MKPGYITITRRQSNNQWSAGIAAHPAPNFPSAKIRWKYSHLDFWIKTASSLLITFPKAKLSTRSITHLCWCNWRTFWRKNAAENHQGLLFLHYNAPAHLALATQKKLAYLGFRCLDYPPYSPDLAPSDYHLFPGLKKQLKGCHFSFDAEVGVHCCRGEVTERTTYWNFFWVACKIYSNGLRSVLSFVESMFDKSRVCSL